MSERGRAGAVGVAGRADGAGSTPYDAVVVVASNRAATGVYEDRTGPLIVTALRAWGFAVPDPVVVPDGEPVACSICTCTRSG